jgi:hypothetical protein
MNATLRLTDSNSASDSRGRTWGLEGNLIWWLIGGLGASLVLFFLLIVAFKTGLMTAFGFGLLPALICLAYIFGLRHGKPPGYDRDCVEHWLGGPGFAPEPESEPRHPLSEEGQTPAHSEALRTPIGS